MKFSFYLFSAVFTGFILLETRLWAKVPLIYEPDYAEALLAFHDKNFSDVMQHLRPGLKANPNMVEYLELLGLTWKAMGDYQKATNAFLKVLKVLKEGKKLNPELLPYRFELGLLYFKQKKYAKARRELEAVSKGGFQSEVAHFFLGLMNLEEDKLIEAEDSFKRVVSSEVFDVSVPAHLYLAQIAGSLSDMRGMVNWYQRAQGWARYAMQKSPSEHIKSISEKVIGASELALRPLMQSKFFGSVGLVTGFDSNVFAVPDDVTVTAGTGKSTLKETLQLGLGYATASNKEWQWALQYRGLGNYNLNSLTRAGQFISNDLAFYLNKNPLLYTSYGTKVSVHYLFQYAVSGDQLNKYVPASLDITLAPYYRITVAKAWAMLTQLSIHPRKTNYGDKDTTADQYRSGWEAGLLWSMRRERRHPFFTPTISLEGQYRGTQGTEYRAKIGKLEFSNTASLNNRTQVTQSLAYSVLSFDARATGVRTDKTLELRVGGQYRLTPSLTSILDLLYTSNQSNVTAFQYNRFTTDLGVVYSF